MSVITQIPEWPLRTSGDQNDFSQKVEAVFGSMPALIAELNAYASSLNASLNATSGSSINISAGTKTFAVSAGLGFLPGMPIYAASSASPSNRMLGYVTSYNDVTGILVIDVQSTSGAGTFNSWVIALGFELMKKANNATAIAGTDDYDYMTALRVREAVAALYPRTNAIINGGMSIDQRYNGASHTITAGAALAYTVDRWYAYCSGANVTGQRVAGLSPNQFNYQFTGAAGVTKIGYAQRIEAANSQDFANTTATFSVDLANSLLTTVTWTAWRANTTDTFGSLASPTRTQIGTGTFTVSSTIARYSAQISVPAAATTGIEIELSVGAQTSGTWTIGRFQFNSGSVASAFEVRPFPLEFTMCQRYYERALAFGVSYASSGTAIQRCFLPFKVTKRAAPVMGLTVNSGSLITPTVDTATVDCVWIGFGAASAGLQGVFNVTAEAEL